MYSDAPGFRPIAKNAKLRRTLNQTESGPQLDPKLIAWVNHRGIRGEQLSVEDVRVSGLFTEKDVREARLWHFARETMRYQMQ